MKHNWLRLEQIKLDSFRGECDSPAPNLRTFGGQVLAQAMKAAYSTVPEGFLINSFHCYFIRGGEEKLPIIYEVKRLRNGRNFVIRTVEAMQHGKVIHSSEFSFQKEPGSVPSTRVVLTPTFPKVPPPEELMNLDKGRAELTKRGGDPKAIRGINVEVIAPMVELKPTDYAVFAEGLRSSADGLPKTFVWIKYKDIVDIAATKLSHCTLAYLSDLTLVNTGMLAFKPGEQFKMVTSLDHSAWMHEFRFDVNEWLLYEAECVSHASNRSLVNARIWTRSGRLLASTAQEVLIYTRESLPVNDDSHKEAIKAKL